MNGVHDMGGMECFGSLTSDGSVDSLHESTLFHHDWERTVLALSLAMGATGNWNLDQSRATRESLPPDQYLSIGYYRIWLAALERLLVRHGLITTEELEQGESIETPVPLNKVLRGKDVEAVLKKGSPVNRPLQGAPAYAVGEAVTVNNQHINTHTRLPGYIRGHVGTVHKIHGAHIFPDSHALGLGEDPRWLYNIRFSAEELWGTEPGRSGDVHVDCWEPYLSPIKPAQHR